MATSENASPRKVKVSNRLVTLEMVKRNVLELLHEKNGICPMSCFWEMYNKQYGNFSKKLLGISKSKSIFCMLPDVKIVAGNIVLRNYSHNGFSEDCVTNVTPPCSISLEEMRSNCVTLLQENDGKLPIVKLWKYYYEKFNNVCPLELGIPKHKKFFLLYPDTFTIYKKQVFLSSDEAARYQALSLSVDNFPSLHISSQLEAPDKESVVTTSTVQEMSSVPTKDNAVTLLKQFGGHCTVSDFWYTYCRKFPSVNSKHPLCSGGQFFTQYPCTFECCSGVVYLRRTPVDNSILPVWGSGVANQQFGNNVHAPTPLRDTVPSSGHSDSQAIDISSDSDSDVIGTDKVAGKTETSYNISGETSCPSSIAHLSSSGKDSEDITSNATNKGSAQFIPLQGSGGLTAGPRSYQARPQLNIRLSQGILPAPFNVATCNRFLRTPGAFNVAPQLFQNTSQACTRAPQAFQGLPQAIHTALLDIPSTSGPVLHHTSQSGSLVKASIDNTAASSVLSIDVLKESGSSLQDVQPIAQDKHVPHSSTHREIWPPEDYRLGVKPGVPRERKKVMVKPVSFKIGHLTMNQVESVAEDCIELLVETGEYISTSRIVQLLLQRFNVRDLRDLHLPTVRFPYHIACINSHERCLAKVNSSIEAFILSRSICTLYDLEQSLLEYSIDKRDFEELKLGPLQCLPIVYDKFKFPQDEKIPDISTSDVLEVFQEYLTKHNKWISSDLDMAEVMLFFVDYYHTTSAYSLGIKFRSLRLAVQVLKKSHRDASSTRKSIVDRCLSKVEHDVFTEFQQIRAGIFEEVSVDGSQRTQLRQHYANMPAHFVFQELMLKMELLMLIDDSSKGKKRAAMVKNANNALKMVFSKDPLAQMLLHIAMCVGKLDLEAGCLEMIAGQKTEQTEQHQQSMECKSSRPSPSKGSVIEKLKHYIERCLSHSNSLSLSNLDRVEERLLEDFGLSSFGVMGYGQFLHFLLHDPEVKTVMEACGNILLQDGQLQSPAGQAPLTDVLDCLRQCKAYGLTEDTSLEHALCLQYHVVEVGLLGFGKISHLVQSAERQARHHHKDHHTDYEIALCGKQCKDMSVRRDVGVLGNQSYLTALACLQSCPLLEDLSRWSQWSLVFEPEHGPIKNFLHKYGGVHSETLHVNGDLKIVKTDITAMVTDDRRILRLVSTTSPLDFQTAVSQADARLACGHLASLVVASHGVEHTPLALLANYLRSALFVLHSPASGSPGAPGADTGSADPAVKFVLQCLLLLPWHLCVAVSNQVFLEPLGQVVGSRQSKLLLLKACLMEPSLLAPRELARLGCMLGVEEWTRPLLESFSFPPDCVHSVESATSMPGFTDKLLGDGDDGGDEEGKSDEQSSGDENFDFIQSFDTDDQVDVTADKAASHLERTENISPEADCAVLVNGDSECERVNQKNDTEVDSCDGIICQDIDNDDIIVDGAVESVGIQDADTEGSVLQVHGGQSEHLSLTDRSGLKKQKTKHFMSSEAEHDDHDEDDDDDYSEAYESADDDIEDGSDDSCEEIDPCEAIINEIRRDEFGVGIKLNKDGQRLLTVQEERIGRSLDRLSRDLYSKDTHFVLELVQNADDNCYPTELMRSVDSVCLLDACPAVRFIIADDGVTVLNNETGFCERDVRALCDVGRSTKGKHKYGYIGQKGIGFKSVFRVTNRPEIHSNGFHLCFDVDSGPMGYILPHWCEDNNPQEEWTTKIVLPLKSEKANEMRSLAARFTDIHPSLLLFLHRLRSIHIDNQVNGSEVSMRRLDFSDNIVEIHHGQCDSVDRWLVVRKRLDASSISIQAKSGVDVESTEIALAFPVNSKLHSHRIANTLPVKQPVFAFLPLRSYGFRFIVQGDFDVPSSREDVDKDSSWNQWLRNELPAVFIEALDVFQAHPDFEGLHSLCAYLQFVPLEDEILDFFKPVAIQIQQKVRATCCMPTLVHSDGYSDKLEWKLPSQTVLVQDGLVLDVISADLLQQHLGLYYVHRDVVSLLNPMLLTSLGVEHITNEHLVQMGHSIIHSWGEQVSDGQVNYIAMWLACIYRSMDDFQDNSTLITELEKMIMIPLSTNVLVSLKDVAVFIMSNSDASAKSSQQKDLHNLALLDVHLVHPRLVSTADDEVNSQVMKMLLKLGVKQLTPYDVIQYHIMPQLQAQRWECKGLDVLVAYLSYIKQQSARHAGLVNMAELTKVAPVLTNKGFMNPSTNNVYFGMPYNVSVDLRNVLPGYEWTLLDSRYLPKGASSVEVQTWRDFFQQLGVSSSFIVRARDVRLARDEIDGSVWSAVCQAWPTEEDGFSIRDFQCEELHQLLSNNSDPKTYISQMKEVFAIVDKGWDSGYSQFTVTELRSRGEERVLTASIPTSFTQCLKTLHWVPGLRSTVAQTGDKFDEEEVNALPASLYVPDPRISRLLSHTVTYLAVPHSPTSSFLSFLAVKVDVQVKVVHNSLVEWGRRSDRAPDDPATFVTSVAHMKHVYAYLFDNLPSKDAQDLFHNNAVIFVPNASPVFNSTMHHQTQAGRMLRRDEVFWQDKSGLFSKYRDISLSVHSSLARKRDVAKLYGEMQDVFLASARLQREPSCAEFAELLSTLASAFSLTGDVLYDVLSIYEKIGSYVSNDFDPMTTEFFQQQEQRQKVMSLLRTRKVLATKGNSWVSADERPLISDDADLEKMFCGKAGVHFVVLQNPAAKSFGSRGGRHCFGRREKSQISVEDVTAFMALFDVDQLSEVLEKEVLTELLAPCVKGQQYLSVVVPLIQRFLATNYHDVHQTHVDNGLPRVLSQFLFFKMKKLEVRYSLKYFQTAFEVREEKCVIVDSCFYFNDKHVESTTEINKEIARFFSSGNNDCMKDLRHFLMEVMPLLDGEDGSLNSLMEQMDIGLVPKNLEMWFVPLPIMKPPTPPPFISPSPLLAVSTTEISGAVCESNTSASLKQWPPMAPGERSDLPKTRAKTESKSSICKSGIWPLPSGPNEMVHQCRQLPSNLHMDLDGNSVASDLGVAVSSEPDRHEKGTVPSMQSGLNRAEHVHHRQQPSECGDGHHGSCVRMNEVVGDHGDGGVRHADAGKRSREETEVSATQCKRPLLLDAPTSSRVVPPDSGMSDSRVLSARDNVQIATVSQRTSADLSRSSEPSNIARMEWPLFRMKHDQFQLPIWTQFATDTEYEQLGHGDHLTIPANFELSESSDTGEIGRWGEQLVYDYLLQQKASHGEICDVHWNNRDGESGKPFDFEVTCKLEDEAYTLYVEVKATKSSKKEIFEISSNEVNFACGKGKHYHIYRVFRAGTATEVRLVRLTNVAHKMDNKEVRLLMVI